MPGLIHKKLWGRSLWGVLAAVVMMGLTEVFVIKALLPGMALSGHADATDADWAAVDYAFLLWGSRALASLVVAAFLLGIGVQPTPSHSAFRHEKGPLLLEDRFDWFQNWYALYKARHRWLSALFQDFWRRLFWAAIGTFFLMFLTVFVFIVLDAFGWKPGPSS